jgi:hypothetical protein
MTVNELMIHLQSFEQPYGNCEVVFDTQSASGLTISKFSFEPAEETKDDPLRYPGLLRIELK